MAEAAKNKSSADFGTVILNATLDMQLGHYDTSI